MIPEEKPTKKTWEKPELQIIAQNSVTGGAQTGYHEGDIQASKATPIAGFQYIFYFKGGGSGLAHHGKSFYYS